MSFRSHVDKFLEHQKQEVAKRLTKAALTWVSDERGFLNVAQPYKRNGPRYTGSNPSRPGQFPHKLSGQLIKSITWDLDQKSLVLRLGSNLAGHPAYLQLGTYVMSPRPWLSLGFAKTKDKLNRIITGG